MVNGPTPEDVIAVRFHLLHFFPAELARKILDDAEYWPRISSGFEPPEELRVVASRQNAFIASKCCVLTPPIPDVEGVKVRTRCVRFRIRSHDQGWGGEAAPGPYENSFTWFEAYIVRGYRDEEGRDYTDAEEMSTMLEERDARPRMQRDGLLIRDKLFIGSASFFGYLFEAPQARKMTLSTVVNPHASAGAPDVWEVQRNRRADRQGGEYEVVWGPQAGVNAFLSEDEYFLMTGSKMGVGFVDALQSGDRIAVLARAQYPGWENCVRGVSVDILLSV